MWFGTDGGLAKYDGRRTQAVSAEGLPQGRVLALKPDADGALWIGTEAGATRLLNGEFRPVLETAGQAVTAIITPERGRVVMASEQGVIFDCRVGDNLTLRVKMIPEQPLTSADVDKPGKLNLTSLAYANGTLYAGTRSRGVLIISNNEAQEIFSTPRAFFVEALEVSARGVLWTGAKARSTDSGLYEAADPLRPLKMEVTTGTVTALRAGVGQDFWVGTDGRGALLYEGSRLVERFTFEDTAGGLRSDHVYSIFVDNEEVVWFGTDRGVCRYDPHGPRNEKVSDNKESNFVRTLSQTKDGRLLAGTNRGLFMYDAGPNAWQPFEELAQKTVYAINEDQNRKLLVGTAGGLYVSQQSARELKVNARFTRIETGEETTDAAGSVRTIAQFQGATYIAIFGRGLERVDGTTRTLIWPTGEATANMSEVVSLHTDGDRLLIGTALAGVFILQGGQVRTDAALDKLRGAAVWDFDRSDDGLLWLASARGLYVYRAGELSLVAPGLDARSVIAIDGEATASREAWCATSGGGLLKVALDDQLGVILSRLDAEQGLPSQNAFAVLALRDDKQANGTLLIGTNRGVSRYEPGRNAATLQPTRIISQRIHQFAELRDGLKLEYPQNSLVLDVLAMSSRTFPERFQYAFQLYDGARNIIKQKFSNDAQFTMEGLRPGKYTVVARAFTRDLIPSAPFQFEFNVARAPFPWTTTALSVLLALSLVALWWGYLQNRRLARTGSMLTKAISQLADARLQLANETETERRRIARDLHDQTLADLRHLLLLTDQLPANGQHNDNAPAAPAVFRREIESISKEVRRICEDLSPSVLENVGLTAALEWAISNSVAHAAPDCKFEYVFACDENLEERLTLQPATQMQIYRIAQEAISNVCRHAAATRVTLTVTGEPDNSFVFKLEDNGREFAMSGRKRKEGRGLSNIRARASLIEAEVSWSKREGGGTVFILSKADAVKTDDAPVAIDPTLHQA